MERADVPKVVGTLEVVAYAVPQLVMFAPAAEPLTRVPTPSPEAFKVLTQSVQSAPPVVTVTESPIL